MTRCSRMVVGGELDLATAPAFALAVDHLLGSGPPRIDVDLATLTFLCAAGIAALHEADRCCRRRGGRLQLERAGPRIRRLLALVGSEALLGPE